MEHSVFFIAVVGEIQYSGQGRVFNVTPDPALPAQLREAWEENGEEETREDLLEAHLVEY